MDAECFKRKFLPFHAKLFRIAYILVESKEDAEDILQDVYFKLWTRREELEDIKTPEAFCVTLVKNACLDFMRSADEVRLVQKLINRLPENQRQVLRLRSMDDCTMEEIEQITGLTAVNIRVLLTRARKTLREQIRILYGKR